MYVCVCVCVCENIVFFMIAIKEPTIRKIENNKYLK